MDPEFTIELKELAFYAFHGIYEEERKSGGEYIIDLAVKITVPEKSDYKIQDTVNYVRLFEIVKHEMGQPRDLLENIAVSIADKIREQFVQLKEIKISIKKKNPPIVNISGSVGVTYSKQF